MLSLHWTLQIPASKNKEKILEVKASAYEYEEVYRICFKNYSQIYYFEIPLDNIYFKEDIKVEAEKYFTEHRNDLDVSKCPRCFKWSVLSGQFCERCKEAMKFTGNTELEIEI